MQIQTNKVVLVYTLGDSGSIHMLGCVVVLSILPVPDIAQARKKLGWQI